jgi:hypothetical protein
VPLFAPEELALALNILKQKPKSLLEECRLLRCGAVWIMCEPTFRRNVSLSSLGLKNPRAKNQVEQAAADLLKLVLRSRIFQS